MVRRLMLKGFRTGLAQALWLPFPTLARQAVRLRPSDIQAVLLRGSDNEAKA